MKFIIVEKCFLNSNDELESYVQVGDVEYEDYELAIKEAKNRCLDVCDSVFVAELLKEVEYDAKAKTRTIK